VGYRIVKFQVIIAAPSAADQISVVQIWNREQSTIVGTVNLTDSELLGVAEIQASSSVSYQSQIVSIIFDQEIFNQDIYVTHKDVDGGESCNYYMELEAIPLSEMGAEYTTLKDIRTATSTI